jgi:hypothetical protein
MERDQSDHVVGEAVMMKTGFHPGRLAEHKTEIMSMLLDLPSAFRRSDGGEWSFLNACMTRNDVQWGEQRNVDQLLALGTATEQVSIVMPRELWSALPGGMPYFVVND